MAELVDAADLKSAGREAVGFEPPSGHLKDRISDLLSEAMPESLDYQG